MAEISATAHSETLLPFVEADPAASADKLRATMAAQGYLFFRRLVPAQAVLAARREVLELCHAAGWLDRSRELLDAVVASDMPPTTEGQPAYMAVYRKVLKLPSFHDFPCHPALMRIAQALLGGQVLVHPRRIGRMSFPNNIVATTPPHQDHYYIRGSVDTYSC